MNTLANQELDALRAARSLSMRNLRNIRRLPSAFFPALAMPIFTMISFSGTFFAVTQLPGFPTDKSVNWYMPLGILFGSAFSGIGLGFSTIRDIETGFYDRLRMSPTPRRALLIGPLFTSWSRVAILTAAVIPIGLLLGARFTGGILGFISLLAASVGVATISLGWGLGLAYRFRDMRAAAIMQLSVFIGLYLTNAQMPLNLIEGWLEPVARANPVTQILNLARQGLVLEGSSEYLSWSNTWQGVLAILVLSSLTLVFAHRGLRSLDK
jgi:ABC-type multidrug transport system permease subunit